MTLYLITTSPFSGYSSDNIVADPNAINSILSGPNANSVTRFQSGLTIADSYIPAVSRAPINTVLPVISGAAQQGQTLSVSNGVWTGVPAPTYAFQWKRAGSNIAGATLASYTAVSADVGSVLSVIVIATNSSGSASVTSAVTGAVTALSSNSTRARFAQDTATAGTTGTAAALFASMTPVSNPSSDRNGTLTTTADPTKYTWIAVTASAAGSGIHVFDGTGYGGFNGAASTSIYSGADADPTTICQTYTDGSGSIWNLYRSSGHSVALTFTLS